MERVSLSRLEIEIVLRTDFVPLVGCDTFKIDLSDKGSVRHPVRSKYSAANIRRATIAAFFIVRVVDVAISVFDVLAAGLISQVMSQTTVPIVYSVRAINAVKFVRRIADVIVVGTSCSCELAHRVLHSFCECLLENRLPNRRLWSSCSDDLRGDLHSFL